jgi:hypothetical protein
VDNLTYELIETARLSASSMGVRGSPWRLYIDPNSKLIIYRNFGLNEDITWANADDKKFKRICTDDMYGAAAYAANEKASGMYIYICIYIYVYLYMYIYIYLYIYIYIFI